MIRFPIKQDSSDAVKDFISKGGKISTLPPGIGYEKLQKKFSKEKQNQVQGTHIQISSED